MAKKPLTIREQFGSDQEAAYIANTWHTFNTQRQPQRDKWTELRNYVFATDTTTTTNRTLPWKNSTTIPKLCQIRDNLHSNYISALFPNDDWLRWEGYSKSDGTAEKVAAIQAYMSNKCRESHFRTEMSALLYDYIDYGNCFMTCDYERSYRTDEAGEKIVDYIGPRARRISPLDIVFNPLASSFKDSFKIVRSIRSIGELKLMAQNQPQDSYLNKALAKREIMAQSWGKFTTEDQDKAEGFMMDGYGSYYEYLQSGYVEVLDFYGELYDINTGAVRTGVIITIIDRMYKVQDRPYPSWLGHAPIYHVGWRKRPDNLWAMGPLENLVGMQYRIDHLENIRADAMDLAIMPPLVIAGEVEQFEWKPMGEIHIDENGTVTELARNVQWVLQAENNIQALEQRMEMYAGAPREAMGIRSPGEKTMFEVQQLENAASRIFQEKITLFETEGLERLLNSMLATAKQNLDEDDWVRVMDDNIGVGVFQKVTREDINATGVLRPIGARHFAAKAQLMSNITQLSNTKLWEQISPHASGLALAKVVEDILDVGRYKLFQPNVAVFEQAETQRMVGQVNEDLTAEQAVSQEMQK